MYNTDMPSRSELPSSKKLIRSTLIALVVAITILVTIVFPAEYAIDPTGMGRVLGLTEMGEIKEQLAEEAELDHAATEVVTVTPTPTPISTSEHGHSHGDGDSHAVEPTPIMVEPDATPPSTEAPSTSEAAPIELVWRDEITFTLTPGQGTEYKLTMNEGAKATYSWVSNGGPLNYDTHGDGGGNSISYEKGRGVPKDEGELEAAFTGNHGWFFRNRNDSDVTVTLRIRGDYGELKKLI